MLTKKPGILLFDEIKKYKSSRTKGVLVVHTYGLPAEIDEISKYCKENDLFLIEDTAEAHGIKNWKQILRFIWRSFNI